jgi:hypothetical protein
MTAKQWKAFEHEMLIKLATTWLACRYKVMGHNVINFYPGSNLEGNLLGMHDYGYEMRLLCDEVKKR